MKSQFRAINRFITVLSPSSGIDGISNTGTFQVTDTSVSGFSLPQGAFTYFVTADFAQTGKEEIFRIVNTAGDVLTYDKRISVGGYVKPTHAAGASIRVNDVADILNEMSDNIDNFGDINQINGTQTVKVWGGVFNNGGTIYNISTTTLAVAGGQLVDNTTNYIHFLLSTQTFSVTASSTLIGAVCMASVVVAGGVIGVITDLRPGFATTYGEITTKLDKTGGLRDGMGLARQVVEIDASGGEVKKAITDGTSISGVDTLRKRKPDGTYEEIVWSNILSLLQSTFGEGSIEYAGETIASQDVLANDYMRAGVTQFLRFGELSSNQKRGFVFTYSGTSGDVRFFVGRSTAFTENFTVKFYTNNSGVPGTLIDTQTVSSANLNPSGTADTTWLVSVTPNLTSRTAGDEIFVEVERSGSLNSTNFFYLGCNNSITDIYFRHYFHNGTVWSAATFNQIPVFGDSVIVNMAIKYNSTVTVRSLGLGVASLGGAIGQGISCVKKGLATITGIKNGQAYKTLGNGTLTPVTTTDTVIAIGYAVDKLLIPFTVAKYVPFVNTNISTLVIPVKNGDTVMIYGQHTAGSGGGVVNTTVTGPGISLAWAPGFSAYDFNGVGVANADGNITIQQGSFPGSTVTVNSLVLLKK